MWKLRGRDNTDKLWSDYGEYKNIADTAERILQLEGGSDFALFFRVYVDIFGTLTNNDASDATILPGSNIEVRKFSICWNGFSIDFYQPWHKAVNPGDRKPSMG